MINNYYKANKENENGYLFNLLASKSQKKLPFTLSINNLRELLPYGKTKIYELLNAGTIPAKKVEGRWIIPRDKFLAWFYGDLDNDDL
ncbi:MAG: helix-turn-helix domain-containing protein [Bacillota bacterium]